MCFKGNLLHGVIPGNGLPKDSHERRISLMIAFWKDISVRPFDDTLPCAAQSLEISKEVREKSKYSWLKDDSHASRMLREAEGRAARRPITDAVPRFVSQVWVPVNKMHKVSRESSPTYDECFQGF